MSEDRERLEDAIHVLHGEEGTGTIRRLLYAFYLVVVLGGVYGFNLLRATLVTSDPAWLAQVASVWGGLAGLALLAAILLLARWVGGVRGPVVPQLPFIDSVVASGLDRAVVLRELGLATLLGGLGIGFLTGALVGGAVLGAGFGGVPGVLIAVALGTVIGLVVAVTALVGQRAASGGRIEHSLSSLLRGLRLDDLRTHAVRTTHVGGAVLAGDLRAARLDVAAPVTRARSARLRSRGRFLTVVSRDLLGLRRAPGRVVSGALGLGTAYALLGVSLTQPAAPRIVGILAMAGAYFAVGALAEGVRLVADNAGTPPLLGLGFRAEASLHLVIPMLGALLIGLPVTATVATLTRADMPLAMGLAAALTTILAGATLMAAFRGAPPDLSFIGEIGPMTMAYWYARPLTLAALSGGLLASASADLGPRAPLLLASGLGTGAFTMWYGLHLARKLELGHRI